MIAWSERVWIPIAGNTCEIIGRENLSGKLGRESAIPIAQPEREPICWEFYSGFQQAVQHGPWKGIRYGTEKPIQLDHLKDDPGESRDLAAKHPDVVARMQQMMQDEQEPNRYFRTRK